MTLVDNITHCYHNAFHLFIIYHNVLATSYFFSFLPYCCSFSPCVFFHSLSPVSLPITHIPLFFLHPAFVFDSRTISFMSTLSISTTTCSHQTSIISPITYFVFHRTHPFHFVNRLCAPSLSLSWIWASVRRIRSEMTSILFWENIKKSIVFKQRMRFYGKGVFTSNMQRYQIKKIKNTNWLNAGIKSQNGGKW